MTASKQPAHKWAFAQRFRRATFGWKSDLPIQRIKEALAEIKQVARIDPVLAAEGAVLLLEKLSPALEHVDSSSGAIGTAVNRAIDTLAPIIAKAAVDVSLRQRWLERLWQALQEDRMPYIESLGGHWGTLCGSPDVASAWADTLLPTVEQVWQAKEYSFFNGTEACLAALHAAGRHQDLLVLLEKSRYRSWSDRQWGVKALLSMGQIDEALNYAEATRGRNQPDWAISEACEALLLAAGRVEEAYCYATTANQASTYLATFRAVVKKYPGKPPTTILRDLVASQPGNEGKWFAAAKDAGLFEAAIDLATRSPTDPRTLTRAARDYAAKQPDFALAAGQAALHWMARGYGYDLTLGDVQDAYDATLLAASHAGMGQDQIKQQLRTLISQLPENSFVRQALGRQVL